MSTKVSWGPADYAAQEVLDDVYTDSGHSYRRIEELSHSAISYNRVRDICLGRRAPVRLSEMLIICETCHVDALVVFKKILGRAKDIELQELRDEAIDKVVAHPEDYDLAALRDPHEELEQETPRD